MYITIKVLNVKKIKKEVVLMVILEALFSTLPYLVAYKNISPYVFSLKRYLTMEITIVIAYSILKFVEPNLASVAIYILPILFIYLNSRKLLISIFLDVFICILIIFTDSLIGVTISNFTSIKIEFNTLTYYMICLIILIAVYFLSKITGILFNKYKNNLIGILKSRYAIIIYISLVITFGLFYFNINWNTSNNPAYLNSINNVIFIFYSLILVLVCFSIYLVIKKEETYKMNKLQLENLKEYTNSLEELYMDMRKFRHDYINILSAMNWYIQENDMESLEKFFSKNIQPLDKQIKINNSKLGMLKNIRITEVKGIIASKLIRAQELGIDVNIEVMDEINYINIDIIDLIRSLGILLDNSIEAAINSEEKYVGIAIVPKENSVVLIVDNTFSGEIKSISKLFKEGYSTKGENRGLGLSNLKELLENKKNILLDTFVNNDKFVQVITIKN